MSQLGRPYENGGGLGKDSLRHSTQNRLKQIESMKKMSQMTYLNNGVFIILRLNQLVRLDKSS
jgi:hypothetical protein